MHDETFSRDERHCPATLLHGWPADPDRNRLGTTRRPHNTVTDTRKSKHHSRGVTRPGTDALPQDEAVFDEFAGVDPATYMFKDERAARVAWRAQQEYLNALEAAVDDFDDDQAQEICQRAGGVSQTLPGFPGRGLRVMRPLVNRDALSRWLSEIGAMNAVPDTQVTVLNTRADVLLPLDQPVVVVPPADFTGIVRLGPVGAASLCFSSPVFAARHREAMAAGASDDGSDMGSHLTLGQVATTADGTAFDWSTVRLPSFPLVFGPETAEPVQSDRDSSPCARR